MIDNSCTILDKLSAKSWGNYLFSGGNDYVNFKKGYSSLIRAIVEELPTGSLFLNSPVMKVKWQKKVSLKIQDDIVLDEAYEKLSGYHVTNTASADVHRDTVLEARHNGIDSKALRSVGRPPVMVLCSSGAVYTAGHVIVTCSLGCLKDNCKTMFEPELPCSMIQVGENILL